MPIPAMERSDLDRKLVKSVYDAAALGTEIFNKNNFEGCFRLYQGTLISVQPLLDARPKLAQSVKDKMDRAKNMTRRAFSVNLSNMRRPPASERLDSFTLANKRRG